MATSCSLPQLPASGGTFSPPAWRSQDPVLAPSPRAPATGQPFKEITNEEGQTVWASQTVLESWSPHVKQMMKDGHLVLILKKVQHLPRTWLLTTPSPYVLIRVMEGSNIKKTHKTRVVDKDQNPEYEERFVLELTPSVGSYHLRFEVWDGSEPLLSPREPAEMLASGEVSLMELFSLQQSERRLQHKILGETGYFSYHMQGNRQNNGRVHFALKPCMDSDLPGYHLKPKKQPKLEWQCDLFKVSRPDVTAEEVRKEATHLDLGSAIYDPGKLRQIFERYDVQNKGYLTLEEMEDVYDQLDNFGLSISDQTVERALRHTSSQRTPRGQQDRINLQQFGVIMMYFARQ